MENIADIMEMQKNIETSVWQKILEIETQIKEASSHPDSMEHLSLEFNSFRVHVRNIFQLFQNQLSTLKAQIDNMEMRHRRKFLIINGVPEEAEEDARKRLVDILSKNLQLKSISPSSLSIAHRIGNFVEGRTRPILFRFTVPELRAETWKKKAQLKGSPFVLSEFLSKQRKTVFIEARKHFGFRNVWTFDGVINVKLPDGNRKKIVNDEELKSLTQLHPNLVSESSSTQPAGSVVSSQKNTNSSSRVGEQSRPKRNKK